MSKFLESQQPNCNSTASDGTSSEDKSGEISFASRTCARSTGASSQPPAKRAKSVISAKSVRYEDEPCIGCAYIQLKVKQLEKELADLRTLMKQTLDDQNVSSTRVPKTKSKTRKTRKNISSEVPSNKGCNSAAKSADAGCSRTTITMAPIRVDSITTQDVLSDVTKKLPVAEVISPKPLVVNDGISILPGDDITGSSSVLLPSCSRNHSERPTEHVSECENMDPWEGGRGKRHDRSLKSKPALMGCSGQSVDSKIVRPSDDSVNRPNPHAANSPERKCKEDHNRQQCLVIQGLSESNAIRPEDRVSEDLASFHGLLNHFLQTDMEIKVLKAFRIGKRSADTTAALPPRPLKIMLENKEQIRLILSKKANLRNTHTNRFFSTGLLTSGTAETSGTRPGVKIETERGRTQSGYLQGEGSSEKYAVSVEPASNTKNDGCYSSNTDTFVKPPAQGDNTSKPLTSSVLTEAPDINGTHQVTEVPGENCVRDNGVMLKTVTNATGNSVGAKLRCLYTNAQSLISKLDELKLCLAELSPDVLAVTETWLSGNINDSEIALPGYQIYRRDREHRQGGAIVVYVNECLAVSENSTKFACGTEAIWLTIKAIGSPCLDVLTVYRPPRTDQIADTQLLEQLEKFSSRPNIMIMGDFNAPGINWNTLQASGPKTAFDYRLLNKTLKVSLTQHAMFPTRAREGQRTNCLDLVFTKTPDNIDEITSMPPLGRSDPVVLMWDYSLFSISHTSDQKRRNVWRGDFNGMRVDLSGLDWNSLFTGNANDDWELFKNVLLQLINNHCPLTSVRLDKRPGWLNSNLKKEVNRKHKLWRKYCVTGQVEYFNTYKTHRNKMKKMIIKTRREFEKKLLQKATQNPKLLYSYPRRSTRNRHQIPLIRTTDGVEIADSKDKAAYFSQFFQSVYTNEARFLPPSTEELPTPSVSHILFSEGSVRSELEALNESKSPGPDEIPPKFLKELASELSVPLSMLFQTSFDTGTLPIDWKLAHITPLYKGGSRA
ncbi:hypothetical protein SprV_0200949900 [Sparganum proliferum]